MVKEPHTLSVPSYETTLGDYFYFRKFKNAFVFLGSSQHYSSLKQLLQLSRQFWQSLHKSASTATRLLPPQVWYQLWKIIFKRHSARMRRLSQASQQACKQSALSYYWLTAVRPGVQVARGGRMWHMTVIKTGGGRAGAALTFACCPWGCGTLWGAVPVTEPALLTAHRPRS